MLLKMWIYLKLTFECDCWLVVEVEQSKTNSNVNKYSKKIGTKIVSENVWKHS